MANLRWLGHSSFELNLSGRTILFDPWFGKADSGMPREVSPAVSSRDIKRADLILVTHEHFDHSSTPDVADIVARTFAHVVAPTETLNELGDAVPARQRVSVNEGDSFNLLGVDITVTEARHPRSAHPVGYIIGGEGKRIYHAGDTHEFYGMNQYSCDVAMLPIGGTYTMDTLSALNAIKNVRCRQVVPMHYNTFSRIRVDVDDFAKRVRRDTKAEPVVLSVGDSLSF